MTEEKDDRAGLIHQPIPDMAGTEPRPVGERASDKLLREIDERVHHARANGVVRAVRDAIDRNGSLRSLPIESTSAESLIDATIVESLNYFARTIFATIGDERFKDCTPDDMLRFIGVCAKRTTMRIGSGTSTRSANSGIA